MMILCFCFGAIKYQIDCRHHTRYFLGKPTCKYEADIMFSALVSKELEISFRKCQLANIRMNLYGEIIILRELDPRECA